MENLWDAVRVAVYFLCSQYGKQIKMFDEEWAEFRQIVMYKSVLGFLNNKIGPCNSYSKEHSFYQNVYSVVWSRFYRDLVSFQNQWVKPKMNSIDRMLSRTSAEKFNDDCIEVAFAKIPKYVHSGERALARQDLRSWLNGPTNVTAKKFREQELQDEISEARAELLGEDYKPTDWNAYRKERRSLREERLKNENCNSSTGEGNPEGRRTGESHLHAERAGSREPVPEAKRSPAKRKGSKR